MEVKITAEDFYNTRTSILNYCDITSDGQLSLKADVLEALKGNEETRKYLESVIKTIPQIDNPISISNFNYEFSAAGNLCNKDTGKPFHWVNQSHYDALGDVIVKDIQKLMVEKYGLQETFLPLHKDNVPKNNIFISAGALECETLILIIQGAGAVRAGQWARALCINENLSLGTIFPYLENCKALGYGVIVFNPNLNEVPVKEPDVLRATFLKNEKILKPRVETQKIEGSENYIKHGEYIWKNFVEIAKAKTIGIVAHSRGGDNTVHLVSQFHKDFKERVAVIAFTDSVHHLSIFDSPQVRKFIRKKAKNWVTSEFELGKVVRESTEFDCIRVSAGHPKHEYTSGVAINSVFDFLKTQIENFQSSKSKK